MSGKAPVSDLPNGIKMKSVKPWDGKDYSPPPSKTTDDDEL